MACGSSLVVLRGFCSIVVVSKVIAGSAVWCNTGLQTMCASVWGRAVTNKRGAVVIGVNKTGNLQSLESAVDGAEVFGAWLASEGFEVKTITDKSDKVTPQQIQQAIETFVNAGNCHQLVIYFSGHGYWKNDAELWLLSDAPSDANAAVSWVETAEFAKDCGIPSVVMISDACRSIPANPKDLRVRGSIVFPNDDIARSRAKVDKFMAAIVGTSAYEIPMGAAKKQSVFTHCFLQAFAAPDPDLIKQITEDGVKIDVIPNRRLGKFLQRCMTATMATANVQYDPTPDVEVLSDEDIYIGKARVLAGLPKFAPAGPTASFRLRRKPSKPIVQIRDVAEAVVGRAMDSQVALSEPGMALALEQLSKTSGFDDAIDKAKAVAEISHFETQTGFAILGASIKDIAIGQGGQVDIVERGSARNPAVVRVHLTVPAQSVVLQFASGQGTVLAALRGYIGNVHVEDKGVMNVSYIPSANSPRWTDYEPRRERLDQLRAAAAAAVRFGVFRLDEKQAAASLAEHIRVLKGLDPSLGLYAAYAYSDADRRSDVVSVLEYMKYDIEADLFDMMLLARKKITPNAVHDGLIVPFCPMLTQGWNFLRARNIALPKVLEDAQDELEPALWTTFKPGRAQLIFEAIKDGKIL